MKNTMSVQTAIEKITYYTREFPEEPFRVLSENPQEGILKIPAAGSRAIST